MISIQQLSKSFGNQVLLKNASLQINAGDRFALIGPNGAGKSTLFRMILGEYEPDSGSIQSKKYISMGYLPQETAPVSAESVLDEALSGCLNPDGRTEAKAKEILMGLGFKISDFARPVKTLSGGWTMRVVLARLLLENPDMLLLDEPTNHLDLESLEWLQDWLLACRSAVFVISHDRHFIDTVCRGIVSLENGELRYYNGDYDFFLRESAAARERLESEYKQQQDEIEHLKDFIQRNRARLSSATRAQSAMKKLEKIELIKIPPPARTVSIRFPQPTRTGLKAISLKQVSKSYGDVKVYENLDFELERGARVALAGHNGAGKSTLLKMLAGVLQPDSGERVLGPGVKTGYFSQHRAEMLDPDKTVLEEAMDCSRLKSEVMIRTVLGTFLFSGDAAFKRTEYLSGGEKSRLALVKLLLDPPNVLLLDEPTTHLDLNSVEALINALKEYEGAICTISHDIYFLNELCNHTVHVNNGVLSMYPGNYDYFHQRQLSIAQEAAASLAERKPQPASEQKTEQKRQAPDSKNQRKLETEITKLEKEIELLKTRVGALAKELETPAVHADYARAKAIGDEISALMADITSKTNTLQTLLESWGANKSAE